MIEEVYCADFSVNEYTKRKIGSFIKFNNLIQIVEVSICLHIEFYGNWTLKEVGVVSGKMAPQHLRNQWVKCYEIVCSVVKTQ